MQLNVYVPQSKARIVEALDEAARRSGKQKNELVLAAIEAYLVQVRPTLGVYHLGTLTAPHHGDIELERWEP